MLNISCKKVGGIWYIGIGDISITISIISAEGWEKRLDKASMKALVGAFK